MKKILSIVVAVMLLMGMMSCVGCTNSEKASDTPKETSTTEPSSEASSTEDKNEDKKEEATAESPKATKSDTLVVYTAGPKGLAEGIEVAFEKNTGVQVELYQGTTGNILSKLEAEKGNQVADVVVLASWPSAKGLKDQGMTMAYKGAANADKLHKGFVDEDFHIFGYSASALGITYNTKLVTQPGKDWSDYTSSEWKGKVNIPDPSLSGSCMDFISGYQCTFGEDAWKLFEALKANEATIIGANKEALDPVITGAKSAVLAGVDYMAYSAKAKGEPIEIIYPSSGTVVNPRTVSILNNAKNVDNAKLFVDFMLSEEAQKLVVDAYIIPGREDVQCDNRANMKDIPLLTYDWDTMTAEQVKNIEKFTSIFQ